MHNITNGFTFDNSWGLCPSGRSTVLALPGASGPVMEGHPAPVVVRHLLCTNSLEALEVLVGVTGQHSVHPGVRRRLQDETVQMLAFTSVSVPCS